MTPAGITGSDVLDSHRRGGPSAVPAQAPLRMSGRSGVRSERIIELTIELTVSQLGVLGRAAVVVTSVMDDHDVNIADAGLRALRLAAARAFAAGATWDAKETPRVRSITADEQGLSETLPTGARS